jgi:hypothetical protein
VWKCGEVGQEMGIGNWDEWDEGLAGMICVSRDAKKHPERKSITAAINAAIKAAIWNSAASNSTIAWDPISA